MSVPLVRIFFHITHITESHQSTPKIELWTLDSRMATYSRGGSWIVIFPKQNREFVGFLAAFEWNFDGGLLFASIMVLNPNYSFYVYFSSIGIALHCGLPDGCWLVLEHRPHYFIVHFTFWLRWMEMEKHQKYILSVVKCAWIRAHNWSHKEK